MGELEKRIKQIKQVHEITHVQDASYQEQRWQEMNMTGVYQPIKFKTRYIDELEILKLLKEAKQEFPKSFEGWTKEELFQMIINKDKWFQKWFGED